MKPDFLNSEIVNVIFGKGVEVVKPCNIYGATIEDNVFIGPFVEIQSDVHIGKGSKIQSHTFICSLVEIGSNVFVGHGVMFTNDKFKSGKLGGGKKNWFYTTIEDNVLIGSNATILPVRIKSGSVIGAGSVVTKDLKVKGIYAGNPAKLIRKI